MYHSDDDDDDWMNFFFNSNFSQWSVVCHCVSACRHFGKIDNFLIFVLFSPIILEFRLIGKNIMRLT